jgi:hypothetical protein
MRSPSHIGEEISFWLEKGFDRFLIWDDNFTLNKEFAYEVCDEIEKRSNGRIHYLGIPNGVRADRLTEDLLKRMRAVGFNQLSIGVESFDDAVLAKMKKGETTDQIEKAVQWATVLGFEVYLYFIIGAPGDSFETFMKSLEFAQKYPVAEFRFYKLIPFPETELFTIVTDNDAFLIEPQTYLNYADHFSDEPIFETPEFPRSERIKAFRMAWDITNKMRKDIIAERFRLFGPLRHKIVDLVYSPIMASLYKMPFVRRYIKPKLRKLMRI